MLKRFNKKYRKGDGVENGDFFYVIKRRLFGKWHWCQRLGSRSRRWQYRYDNINDDGH